MGDFPRDLRAGRATVRGRPFRGAAGWCFGGAEGWLGLGAGRRAIRCHFGAGGPCGQPGGLRGCRRPRTGWAERVPGHGRGPRGPCTGGRWRRRTGSPAPGGKKPLAVAAGLPPSALPAWGRGTRGPEPPARPGVLQGPEAPARREDHLPCTAGPGVDINTVHPGVETPCDVKQRHRMRGWSRAGQCPPKTRPRPDPWNPGLGPLLGSGGPVDAIQGLEVRASWSRWPWSRGCALGGQDVDAAQPWARTEPQEGRQRRVRRLQATAASRPDAGAGAGAGSSL